MSKVVLIINAFNAGDNLQRFSDLVLENDLLKKEAVSFVFNKLNKQFNTIGSSKFLTLSATKRQAELLIANGELTTHRNMFNTLNALKEQKEVDEIFIWIEDFHY